MSVQFRIPNPSGLNPPAGGGGKPPEKPGSGKPGRAHEKEKPVVPLSRQAKKTARKHESMAQKIGSVSLM